MTPDRPDEPEHGIDVDAAFADIVAHYGEVPTVEEPTADQAAGGQPDEGPPADGQPEPSAGRQQPDQPVAERPADAASRPVDSGPAPGTGWDDPVQTPASWEDEGHFVPPPPPPLPVVEPRRRAAWLALFGAPLVMLVVIVAGVGLPGWVVAGLALAFIGGFVYLVATMGGPGRGTGWPDDGAVV